MGKKTKRKKAPDYIDRTKFIESIYHIVYFGNIIRNFESLFSTASKKLDEQERRTLRLSLQWNVLILTISLIDEINNYLFKYITHEAVVQDRINSFKHIVEPALDELNEWPDLRSFRNNVLAHNSRVDKKDFISVHLSNSLQDYNIPNTVIDFFRLIKYLKVITKVAEEIFNNEYKEALSIVQSFSIKSKESQSIQEECDKANNALIEMNRRIEEYNERLRKQG